MLARAAGWCVEPSDWLPAVTAKQVTSYKMALKMESEVVGGPTAQGQPVFEWGSNWPDFEHRGQPNR